MHVKVACIQTNTGDNLQDNLQNAERAIQEAAAQGAQFVSLPENAVAMEKTRDGLFANAYIEDEHPAIPRFARLAKELACWIHVGSMPMKEAGLSKGPKGRLRNRTYLFSDTGAIAARYDKIHMFDADIGAEDSTGKRYHESGRYAPGSELVTAVLPWATLGLTICYDLRFPQHYRELVNRGASILTVPSAFTRVTGAAHWHVLLRARAIETGSFVIAAAQCGTHPGNRQTYGHSLIVDPWGRVLADGGEAPGVVMAELDMQEVDNARSRIPAWNQV